jgi:Ca-activated chloride channel family protein
MMTMPQGSGAVASASPAPATQDSPGQLVALDGRKLPLVATAIEADARGGIARVVLKQRFANPYDEALAVRYQVPLPADGAVSGFAFQLGERRVVGQVDGRDKARERYERAIVEGRTAALLEHERSSLFTQDVGNIPPRTEVVAEITIDQKLRWLAEGSWEWRFPTVVAPRYHGVGRVSDAQRLAVDVADGELEARAELSLAIGDAVSGRVESPSHPIAATQVAGSPRVALRSVEGARLDRDVVVRWAVTSAEARADVALAAPAATHAHAGKSFALLTIVPPDPTVEIDRVARDLILLIDSSGSMQGEPLAQARRVALALIEGLDERDQLEMIEFSWRPERWKPGPVPASRQHKKEARAWLEAIEASGGTEMRAGILEALRPLRQESQRQVILISDGLIGFEREIIGEIADRLPPGSRVHTVGVGSAVNRSLTGPAARAGRGVEAGVGVGEDAERAAQRLVAHTAVPVVVGLELHGAALRARAPERLPDLLAGAPALVALEVDPAGGALELRGRTAGGGTWASEIIVPPALPAGHGPQGIVALFARERVEDLELALAAGAAADATDRLIEGLGLSFQIATRLTSWVAITDEATVDPTAPSRREQMPHELPHGMSAALLGLRAAPAPASAPSMALPKPMMPAAPLVMRPMPAMAPRPPGPPPPLDQKQEKARELRPTDEVRRLVKQKEAPAGRAAPARGKAVSLGATFGALDGEIIVRDDDRVVVSLRLRAPLSWRPESARIELADGSVVAVTLIAELTTRPCEGQPGQVLRLALRFARGALGAELRAIHLENDGATLVIRV